MKVLDKILKYDLCLGCGLCSSIIGNAKCSLLLSDNGFYRPVGDLGIEEDNIIRKICPGICVVNKKCNDIWGNLEYVVESWATDEEIRYKAASGGVVTSIAIYLLEHKIVDAILQVGVRSDSYLYNELKVSRTKVDIINNAQSRYAPAPIFDNIKQILDASTDIYGFIGKPCDIAGLKNFMAVFPEYKHRIKIYISIFCAGMPSYNATIKAWRLSGKEQEPVTLKYRGDGWPGFFTVRWADNTKFKLSYNESWGKILGRQLGFRCKICPDGIGMLADIAVTDATAFSQFP